MSDRNALYYGDNLDILRHHIASESVALVYLDPPFNSNRAYNVLFKEKSGEASPSQIEAFTDTWEWDRAAERTYDDIVENAPHNVAQMISALRQFVGTNDMMAYLVMMAVRLVELHRVLKPTGSLYLHCDPTASHYLKVILDTVFGTRNFRNEVIWKRTHSHGSADRWGDVHDTILYYAKGPTYSWNRVLQAHDEDYLTEKYRASDERGRYQMVVMTAPGVRHGESGKAWRGYDPTVSGRHWAVPRRALQLLEASGHSIPTSLNEQMELLLSEGWVSLPRSGEGRTGAPRFKLYVTDGTSVQDVVTDIPPINSQAKERLGYPTQKPLALLERIIAASSTPGDVVLDPFCGCGTAIIAAEKLGRRWIGIDITHLSISLMRYRMNDAFPDAQFDVKGEPADSGSARMLAESDRYQFQWWALSLIRAKPIEGREKKGADRGIDGVITFQDDRSGKLKRCLVQVKSGHVSSATMRDLTGTLNREKAEMGILVTLEPTTAPMRLEAAQAGSYRSEGWGRDYPKMQILTIDELLVGKMPELPPARQTFARAERVKGTAPTMESLFGDE